MYSAHSRHRALFIGVLQDASDAGDDGSVEDVSAEADDSGETEESDGEVSGAEDVDDAAEASAPVILGSSVRSAGGVGGDGDAAEAGHASVFLGTGVAGVIAKGSDGEDPSATANRPVPGSMVPNVRVGGKAIVAKDLRDPGNTFGDTDAPDDAYTSDAADPSDFTEGAKEKEFEPENLFSSGEPLFRGKFGFICLYVIPFFLFNMI